MNQLLPIFSNLLKKVLLLSQACGGKNKVFEVRWTWIPTLPLTSCVALGKLPHLSEPQSPHLQNGDKQSILFSG